eukprot:TRINITY_DN5250_c0_g1_i2.p1 TRINITY_DN5250_c0_g1~~TRINITY_DN5250_c0_g1_i2.p1  ORF type:complete len:442 (-),score=103.23 TRINITY_DN5250_c0_g1_i2:26-1351(-)
MWNRQMGSNSADPNIDTTNWSNSIEVVRSKQVHETPKSKHGHLTVKDGEAVLIWKKNGRATYVEGPARPHLWGSKYQFLRLVSASQKEFLAIKSLNGEITHVRGPKSIFLNPTEHEYIALKAAINVSSGYCIVVYTEKDGDVTRRLIHGPAVFFPSPSEWAHQFSWHGSVDGKTSKVPNGLKFQTLRTISDSMYYNVPDVRTKDDALLVIKIMVFFHVVDIERMLDCSHDVVADLINAANSDVIRFVGSLTFEEFGNKAEQLNDMSTFKTLSEQASRVGYDVSKVVYRGYQASNALQAMHDQSIEARTELRLKADTDLQGEDLEDMRVARKEDRNKKVQSIEEAEVRHKISLAEMEHETDIKSQTQQAECDLIKVKSSNTESRFHEDALDASKLKYYTELSNLGVDLTQFLVALNTCPTQHIKLDSGKGSTVPEVHLPLNM